MDKRNGPVLLLADNDSKYRRSLRSILELENCQVIEAGSIQECQERMKTAVVKLALVDLRLTDDDDPNDISGLEVAKIASTRGIPCIIVTAFASVEAMRLALRSLGVDPPLALDVIPKASGPHAILDAIRIALSQNKPQPTSRLVIDLERQLAWLDGNSLDLSRQQYVLLSHMYRQRGAVCSSEELIKVIYDEDVQPNEATTDKRLERLIARVREKIEAAPSDPCYLVNVQGRGYLLNVDG